MKKSITLSFIISILIFLISACGVQVSQNYPDNQTTDEQINNEKEESENNSKYSENTRESSPTNIEQEDQTIEPSNSEDVSNPEDNEAINNNKYYVNPHNFRIYPLEDNEDEKIVVLTFDDGPKGDSTLQILDVLDKYEAKSLWFISGFNYGWNYKPNPDKSERFKELILEIKNRGHTVGNHTWEHENLRQLPDDKVEKEIVELNNLLENITGERPRYFRAPFGANSDESENVVKKETMQAMNWSVGSLDWELKTPEAIANQTLTTMHNGANILFHDKEITAESLEIILSDLKQQGYQFVVPTEIKYKED